MSLPSTSGWCLNRCQLFPQVLKPATWPGSSNVLLNTFASLSPQSPSGPKIRHLSPALLWISRRLIRSTPSLYLSNETSQFIGWILSNYQWKILQSLSSTTAPQPHVNSEPAFSLPAAQIMSHSPFLLEFTQPGLSCLQMGPVLNYNYYMLHQPAVSLLLS